MDTLELYKLWLEKATDDPDLTAELSALDPEKDKDAMPHSLSSTLMLPKIRI